MVSLAWYQSDVVCVLHIFHVSTPWRITKLLENFTILNFWYTWTRMNTRCRYIFYHSSEFDELIDCKSRWIWHSTVIWYAIDTFSNTEVSKFNSIFRTKHTEWFRWKSADFKMDRKLFIQRSSESQIWLQHIHWYYILYTLMLISYNIGITVQFIRLPKISSLCFVLLPEKSSGGDSVICCVLK